MVQKQSMSTTTTEAVTPDVQAVARQLLRRLIAERNLRTTGISQILGVETHTLRRMLNGSRAIALDEMVLIARLGGYSLDEHFGLHSNGTSNGGRNSANVNDGLGRVFAAIAELLSSAPAGSHNFESRDGLLAQRRGEVAPRAMSAQLSVQAQESLARILAGEGEKRKRGRPRKVA
jgi:plasmid maintenance system antidote protein VapI